MQRTLLLLLICIIVTTIRGQAQNRWAWAKTVGGVSYNINPSYPRQVVAAHQGHVLWGVIQNRKMTYRQVMLGDYILYNYDPAGALKGTTSISGKVSLTAAKADAAGNWYILGTFYDSILLSNGLSLVRTIAGSEHFLMRLRAGTLVPDWIKPVGDNSFCSTECFDIVHGNIVLPIDSSYGTAIALYIASTGARATLWSQTGRSYTSYIEGDSEGNIYLMGHCALSGGVDFNGTPSPPMSSSLYPWYIARYHTSGLHHWHYWLTDISCFGRSFLLSGDTAVYLSGILADSTTLGAHHFSKPTGFFNADFLFARLDSNGSIVWAQQRPVTSISQGNLSFSSQYHMAVADTSLYMFSETQGAAVWGGGIATSTGNRHNGTLVAYGGTGSAKWASAIRASYSIGQQVASDGEDIWVTGVASDSASIGFDSLNLMTGGIGYIPYLAKLNVKARPPAGLMPEKISTGISVWPNPAKTLLHIRSATPRELVLRDLAGRVVWQRYMRGGEVQVETAAWPRGWYLLESKGREGRWLSKILLD